MDKDERSLEFKRHEMEFYKLRESLEKIQEQSVQAKKNIGGVKEYYFLVQSLFLINHSYVLNSADIRNKLKIIKAMISDKNYIESIKTMNKASEFKIKQFEDNVCEKIDEVLEHMTDSFVQVELRPKPEVIDKETPHSARLRQ